MSAANGKFMVLGLAGLVLRDLVETIEESFPELTAAVVNTEAEAQAALGAESGWEYAFLSLGPEEYSLSPLSNMFDTLGTKVILMGDAAENAADSCHPVLARPFMANDILELLRQNA